MSSVETDYSWAATANPGNTPWLPGYRFCVRQLSTPKIRESLRQYALRRYYVYFEVDAEGTLRHTGGVKPNEDTWANVRALQARERPGSNHPPEGEL